VRVREARLKPAYDAWYPKITLGVWHNAAWLSEIVLQQQRRGSPRWALENRPLSEAHFEFQGTPSFEKHPFKLRRAVG
jgi:hypothetical protein